jgi:sRNA-binding carbon storage regulator CsrA
MHCEGGWLVITCKPEQVIKIGEDIQVAVRKINGMLKVAIKAPKHVVVKRPDKVLRDDG